MFGSFLLPISKNLSYLHLSSLAWSTYAVFSKTICPLTYLENWFLRKASMKSYSNSFIEQYLIPIVYPNNLTAELQFYLGFLLILTNIVIYVLAIKFFKQN